MKYKNLLTVFFVALLACSLAVLNAPMYQDQTGKRFTQQRPVQSWVPVILGERANGLQKFTAGAVQVWALNMDNALFKILKKAGAQLYHGAKKEKGQYYVYI